MIFLGKEVKNSPSMPYIVAEISGNHGGKLERAYKLIEEAKLAGADAVKIQVYDADALTLPIDYTIKGTPWNGQNLYELYMAASTPYDWIGPLFEHANKVDISIFSSVYDTRGLQELTRFGCRAFKIASYEANDVEFIRKVAAAGKPVVISTGTLNDIEIERAVTQLDEDNSIILHCVSNYPCELAHIGLQNMNDLMINHSQPIGFSCHCDDPLAVILAFQRGAAMIELHLALDDEEGQKSPDYEFSFTKEGLKYTLSKLKEVSLSNGIKWVNQEEGVKYKRSLYVTKPIARGETFTRENIGSYRPNLGCEPYLLPNIIGRKANRNLDQYTPMKMEYVK